MPLTLATSAEDFERAGEPEIFASLQGEGRSMGRPSVFIRLSRCNLACTWCDTAYSWRFSGDNRPHRDDLTFEREANQISLPEEDVARAIAEFGETRLVITGGEPLLQAAALARMLALLPPMHIEVETNGTIAPPPALDAMVDQYNVSPKLAHSGNPGELALLPARLAQWARSPKAWFKFVIAAPEDLDEVLSIQAHYAIAPERIFLMPEGTDSAVLHARAAWLADLCMQHGFRFTDRLHIHLYGDTRAT